ncbi:DUF1643 domain-containing protein [Propioniciclava sinopodophylli]|uniref:DUF1643 domain-containing protein n=1 Tax=Propioniciclava sinopodophylli TaxID=1837344 RepID=A0A4V2JSI4_9ACTN|nr:DUF1643 domain-containing protein [Propioniciclava sinopodophylli]TBT85384.1 DUF1643 domain-containing protein [Propioniciclava sinopodophylli]
MAERGTLLVIGSNPPAETSGQRTLARVQQVATILDFEEAVLANLFALPTYRSGGIADLGRSPDGWLDARSALVSGLDDCDGVLLAYGTQEPSGEARAHHREQVRWLDEQIEDRSLPTWWVGGAPRHPSRWQRYTWRELPGVEFREALERSLCHVPTA